jgi:hypothetical protein
MNSNRKVLLFFTSFFLIMVPIACSFTNLIPARGGETEIPEEPSLPVVTATTAAVVPPLGPPYIEQVSGQINIKSGESGTASASCPVGSITLGGGFASGDGMKITKTMPDDSGWIVGGLNGSDRDLSLTAYAYCLHNDTGNIRVVMSDDLVSGGPRAVCVEGEIITGGGYTFETNTLDVYMSTPNGDSANPGNFWSVMAHNLQSTDQTIRVYALCLSESSLTSTLVRDENVIYGSADSAVSFTLKCPAGAVMASGGYEGTGVFISQVNPADTDRWEVQAREKIYLDGSLDHAVCINPP